jgi:hypothetical protein
MLVTKNCLMCNSTYSVKYTEVKRGWGKFCSKSCSASFKYSDIPRFIILKCGFCNNLITKRHCELKSSISGNAFCNSSCSASFNNKFKRKSRRSKCEIKLFNLLNEAFPDLELQANPKILDGYEIDIFIPSIKLGVEWNGVVHFRPIWGQDKLDKIQDIDFKKQVIAEQKQIELIIVPDLVSSQSKIHQAFLAISKRIKQKLAELESNQR